MKIFDCITFFEENFLLKIRFEILNKFVDYFVICESNYGHDGVKKKLILIKIDIQNLKIR